MKTAAKLNGAAGPWWFNPPLPQHPSTIDAKFRGQHRISAYELSPQRPRVVSRFRAFALRVCVPCLLRKWLNHKDARVAFEAFKLAQSCMFGRPAQAIVSEEFAQPIKINVSAIPGKRELAWAESSTMHHCVFQLRTDCLFASQRHLLIPNKRMPHVYLKLRKMSSALFFRTGICLTTTLTAQLIGFSLPFTLNDVVPRTFCSGQSFRSSSYQSPKMIASPAVADRVDLVIVF